MAESEQRRARFKREAQAIAALDHPNIVQVFSVEEAEGTHFITMQLVQGKTLTELVPPGWLAMLARVGWRESWREGNMDVRG